MSSNFFLLVCVQISLYLWFWFSDEAIQSKIIWKMLVALYLFFLRDMKYFFMGVSDSVRFYENATINMGVKLGVNRNEINFSRLVASREKTHRKIHECDFGKIWSQRTSDILKMFLLTYQSLWYRPEISLRAYTHNANGKNERKREAHANRRTFSDW